MTDWTPFFAKLVASQVGERKSTIDDAAGDVIDEKDLKEDLAVKHVFVREAQALVRTYLRMSANFLFLYFGFRRMGS
jgi:hypothetical protein